MYKCGEFLHILIPFKQDTFLGLHNKDSLKQAHARLGIEKLKAQAKKSKPAIPLSENGKSLVSEMKESGLSKNWPKNL